MAGLAGHMETVGICPNQILQKWALHRNFRLDFMIAWVPTNSIIVPPGINGYKNTSRFQKCEREFVKGNGRNVKMFYSDSYEVRKIVKYIRHGRVLNTYTRFKLTRKLQELFVRNLFKRKLQFNFVSTYTTRKKNGAKQNIHFWCLRVYKMSRLGVHNGL